MTTRAHVLSEIALKSEPRLAKCSPPSLETQSQERAARAFAAAANRRGVLG